MYVNPGRQPDSFLATQRDGAARPDAAAAVAAGGGDGGGVGGGGPLHHPLHVRLHLVHRPGAPHARPAVQAGPLPHRGQGGDSIEKKFA